MMNRGKLEAWAARLYMIHNGLRIPKAHKARALRKLRIYITKLSMKALVEIVDDFITRLEAR